MENPGDKPHPQMVKRAVLALVITRLLHDIESNPGPKRYACSVCRKNIGRTTWSVKCNECNLWLHWECSDLGEFGRWSNQFRGPCCDRNVSTPNHPIEGQPVNRQSLTLPIERSPGYANDTRETSIPPTYPIEGQPVNRISLREPVSNYPTDPIEGQVGNRTRAKLVRRRIQRKNRRKRRQIARDKKWIDIATTIGREKYTPIWTWNIQRARTSFPKRNRFSEILKVVAENKAEIVMFTELLEETPAIKWVKAKDLYGVLIHGKRSGIFLKGEWATLWKQQGCKRECGDRNTSVVVEGIKLIATYQPVWGGSKDELKRYREELQNMIFFRGKMIVGGDFNASIGDTSERDTSKAAGPFGLGKMNPAGRDLLNWCEGEGLVWVNSFFNEKKRGT